MRRVFAFIGVLAIAFGVLSGFFTDISAESAVVLNSGRDDLSCSISGTWNGTGKATLVTKDEEVVTFSCHGVIEDEAPDKAVRTTGSGPEGLTCKVVVTPSGRFSAICHP
jgi:hypothetical protein